MFPPRSLRYKFVIFFSLIIIALMSSLIIFVERRQRDLSIKQAVNHGSTIAQNLASISSNALLTYNYIVLEQHAENAALSGKIEYIIILDKENNIAAYSGHPEKQGTKLLDPINLKAVASIKPITQEVKNTEEKIIDVAVPVYIQGSDIKWGTIRVGYSLETIYQEVRRTRNFLISIGILALILGIAFSLFLSKRITKPLEELVKATVTVSRGEYDYKIIVNSKDEIGELSSSFNKMTDQILIQQRNLQENFEEILSLKKYNDLVLDSMSSGVLAVDMDGKIESINSSAVKITGIEKGIDINSIKNTENIDFYSALKNALYNGMHAENSEVIYNNYGNESACEVSTSSIMDNKNNKVGILAVIRDVTEIVVLRERIERADRLAVLGTVASGLAHDIKNPLSAIRTFVQLLPMKKDAQDFFDQFNITVPRELERINHTIENLLELSRKPQMNFQDININQLLDQVIDVYSNDVHKNNIEVSKQYSSNLPMVQGDAEYLNRAFSNLIINAIQAMSDEGELLCSTKVDNGMISVVIKDTGMGMDEQTARNVFDPYFTTKRKGSGLGLSIVYKIIEDHNGNINLESQLGKGTTFKVSLPISNQRGAISS